MKGRFFTVPDGRAKETTIAGMPLKHFDITSIMHIIAF
jgi:hypothetical protein